MKYILLLLFFNSLVCLSYSQISPKVELTLQKAGKNRGELERVIVHDQRIVCRDVSGWENGWWCRNVIQPYLF